MGACLQNDPEGKKKGCELPGSGCLFVLRKLPQLSSPATWAACAFRPMGCVKSISDWLFAVFCWGVFNLVEREQQIETCQSWMETLKSECTVSWYVKTQTNHIRFPRFCQQSWALTSSCVPWSDRHNQKRVWVISDQKVGARLTTPDHSVWA